MLILSYADLRDSRRFLHGTAGALEGSMRTFKSTRAAKMAFTKAEKVWDAARGNAARLNEALHHCDGMAWEDYLNLKAAYEAAEKAADLARDEAQAIYDDATAQGHFVYSYEFGPMIGTKALIAANID